PTFDFQALTRDQLGRRLNRLTPGLSLVVMKPTGRIPHEGGLRFAFESVAASTLLRWIGAGATDDVSTAPRVKALRAFPSERLAAPASFAQQLVVSAELDDGTRRDVTRQAACDVSDPGRAVVSWDGQVQARGPCEIVVSVRYMNVRATSRLAFLADQPGFVW